MEFERRKFRSWPWGLLGARGLNATNEPPLIPNFDRAISLYVVQGFNSVVIVFGFDDFDARDMPPWAHTISPKLLLPPSRAIEFPHGQPSAERLRGL
jgi:hypothetical protein